MILQALTRYYDILAADPDCPIARMGYSTANVSYALLLSGKGELQAVIPLVQTRQSGKKTYEVARRMVVPEHVVRTVGVKANFLCDSCAYVLGISEKDDKDPNYAAQRFEAFRELHTRLLDGVECPEAQAVTAFLRTYDPQQARQNPLIAAQIEGLLGSGNLVFMVEGCEGFAHDAPEIRRAWETSKAGSGDEVKGQCLVTGEWTKIARLHSSIKGIRGANTSGASLVGFNAPSYESYNRAKGQGWNAPTGEKAAFAYTTVLNYLLSSESENPKFTIGDTTVVYWAESANQAYADLFSTLFDPTWAESEAAASRRDPQANQRLREIAQKVKSGAPMDVDGLLQGLPPATLLCAGAGA